MPKTEPENEPAKAKPKLGIDMFAAKTIFPDAHAVFTSRLPSLQEVKDTACVVLDTNPLLIPYAIGKRSLDDVRKTYKTLLDTKRLLIPAQVAREFAKQRVNKISELHQKLCRQQSQPHSFDQGSYPLLEGVQEYERLRTSEKKIDDLLNEYRAALGGVIEKVSSWEWNDPVSLLYHELFPSKVVVESLRADGEMREELERRYTNKIPPGYKDAAKDDRGIGDLLIWQTILEIGSARKGSLIFVTGEEKADWWHKSEGRQLYPRYELVDEFRRSSGGQSFHIITFSRLLELFGASAIVVHEVRTEESLETKRRQFVAHRNPTDITTDVARWFSARGYLIRAVLLDSGFDFVVERDGQKIFVEVEYVSYPVSNSRLVRFVKRANARSVSDEESMLVIGCQTEQVSDQVMHFVITSNSRFRWVIGIASSNGFTLKWASFNV